jgi:hypothetical protein
VLATLSSNRRGAVLSKLSRVLALWYSRVSESADPCAIKQREETYMSDVELV